MKTTLFLILVLTLGGCQSTRSVTVYLNGAVAARAEKHSQFFYVPGAIEQRVRVSADGAASASQGIEHDDLAAVATAGIVTGGAIALAGGFSPPAIAGGAAVAGAGVIADTLSNDQPTTPSLQQSRP